MACAAQPGGDDYIARDTRALPVCEVETLFTHHGTSVDSNLRVAEKTSAWQYGGTGDGRRRW